METTKDLRPIGTRWTVFSEPTSYSTEMFGKYITWEVVNHVRSARSLTDTVGHPAEEIRAVEVRDETPEEYEYRIKQIYAFNGIIQDLAKIYKMSRDQTEVMRKNSVNDT